MAPAAAAPLAAATGKSEAPKESRLVKAVSGSISGVLISVALQPLDVVRTTMQTMAAKTSCRPGALATVRGIMAEGGIQAMWRGSSATFIRLGLGAGMHFLFLDIGKSLLEAPRADGTVGLSPWTAALVGGGSRAVSGAILCPVTLAKTRLEYGRGAQMYKGPIMAMRQIYLTEGVRGLFRGLGPTILSNAPFSGLYYMFYSELQGRLQSGERNQTLVNFASGTMAATVATIMTQPADVIRTRTQMGLTEAGVGMIKGLRNVVATEGFSGLLTGTSPKVVKKILQTALVWTLYEELVPRINAMASRHAVPKDL